MQAVGALKRLVVAERVAQYGAGNYLENEVAAALQKAGNATTKIISRVYGIGGLNFRPDEDARLKTLEGRFWGAWPGEANHAPPATKKVVKSCLHPLYEVQNGITTINYDPER